MGIINKTHNSKRNKLKNKKSMYYDDEKTFLILIMLLGTHGDELILEMRSAGRILLEHF